MRVFLWRIYLFRHRLLKRCAVMRLEHHAIGGNRHVFTTPIPPNHQKIAPIKNS